MQKRLKENKFNDILNALYDMISYAIVGKSYPKTTVFNINGFIVTTTYNYSYKNNELQAEYHVDVEDTITDYTEHLNFSDTDSYFGYIKLLSET